MPIKLKDLTCEKCIYFHSKGRECRRRSPSFERREELGVWPDPTEMAWCGEGYWPVNVKGTKPLPVLIDRRAMYGTEVDDFEWREDT